MACLSLRDAMKPYPTELPGCKRMSKNHAKVSSQVKGLVGCPSNWRKKDSSSLVGGHTSYSRQVY